MINEIVSGISNALFYEFGANYKIYKEQIKQGLQTPCFSIICSSTSVIGGLGCRSIKKNTFCIHYFSGNKDFRRDCMGVFERMADCLTYILVSDDLVRGTKIQAEEITEDGILHVFIDYNIPVFQMEQKEKMEQYTLETEVGKHDLC